VILLAFAVELRTCSNRSISSGRRARSSKPAAAACGVRMTGRTDRETDLRQFHRPCSAYYASSVSNEFVQFKYKHYTNSWLYFDMFVFCNCLHVCTLYMYVTFPFNSWLSFTLPYLGQVCKWRSSHSSPLGLKLVYTSTLRPKAVLYCF